MVARLRVRHPDFGKRVQAKARARGLHIADIQKGLKVTYEMARRYWEGIAKPRSDRMRVLATLLGCSVGELEYGEAAPQVVREKEVGTYAGADFSDEAREVAMAFQLLSPAQREFYRGQIFRDAALSRVVPWLKTGRPPGENYARYERGMERDMEKRVRQLQLDLK
jgi:transcriptional regulator with XRE-family HTH domain